MPAFKKFGAGDQLDNVLILEPSFTIASGNAGWHGSPDGSASLSLYGGVRRSPAHVITDIAYQSIFPASGQIPKPRIGLPTTASINFVWMTNEVLNFTQRSSTRWGNEHWGTVQRLYQDYFYRDPDFITASYDFYCLYFNSASQNVVTVFDYASSPAAGGLSYALPTGSFTLEAWFNPFVTSSSGPLTLLSHARGFQFFIGGNTGLLGLTTCSGSAAIVSTVTSSVGPTPTRWHHAAVSFDSTTLTGTFYLDLNNVGTFVLSSSIPLTSNYTGSLQIGSTWGGTVTSGHEDPTNSPKGTAGQTFHGFIGETRIWGTARSYSQISGSYNHRLTGSDLAWPLLSCIQLNEGPLAFGSPATDNSALIPVYAGGGLMGSGVLDIAASHRGQNPNFGNLFSFSDRPGPSWHPNGNIRFYPDKTLAPTLVSGSGWSPKRSSDVSRMLVIDIPQAFYGRNIVPGTVSITDRSYSSPSYGLIRTIVDDGRGNLYVSGSACSGTATVPEGYSGVGWNKVGNVFYGEGLVIIRDAALLDFGSIHPDSVQNTSHPNDILQLSFRGQSRIPVKTLMCRIDRGDINATANQTFWTAQDDGNRIVRHPSGNLYISTVGIYDSQYELVGVARLADPVRKRSRDRINIKLRMDF